MSTAKLQFFSDALGKWTSYNLILPDAGEGPFPVLMQLHGLTDDAEAWLQRSNLARHVADLPLVVVLPDGGTSGYVNWKDSGRLHKARYEDLLMQDIPAHLRRSFHVTEGPWAIGGLSMGGYGAMRLGLKYPNLFTSIWAHSSAFHIPDRLDPALVADLEDARVMPHVRKAAAAGTTQTISFDCGVDDELIDHNRALHAARHAR